MNRSELRSSTKLGVYTPSVFLMRYYSNDCLEYVIDSENQFIILHEFIHYLQDISTVYGNMNFCNYYNRLKYGVNQVYKCKNTTVQIPISLDESEVINTAKEGFRFIFGNTKALNKISGNAVIHKCLKSFSNINIPYYCYNKDGKEYIIGACDVLEGMAYEIEHAIYGNKNTPPFFPYKTIENIAKSFAPTIAENRIFISALCELSLNSTNPASLLIDALRRIGRDHITVNHIDDLIEVFTDDIRYFDHEGTRLSSIEALIDYSFDTALKFAKEPFSIVELEPLINWINVSFINAKKLRKSNPLLITKGLLSKNPIEYYFRKMVDEVGCPTIMNNKLDPATIDHPHNTNQVIYLHTVKELMSILFEGKKTCDLYAGCLEESKTNKGAYEVSEKCYEDPWNKTKENKLCPLAKLFHMWGIDKVEYILR